MGTSPGTWLASPGSGFRYPARHCPSTWPSHSHFSLNTYKTDLPSSLKPASSRDVILVAALALHKLRPEAWHCLYCLSPLPTLHPNSVTPAGSASGHSEPLTSAVATLEAVTSCLSRDKALQTGLPPPPALPVCFQPSTQTGPVPTQSRSPLPCSKPAASSCFAPTKSQSSFHGPSSLRAARHRRGPRRLSCSCCAAACLLFPKGHGSLCPWPRASYSLACSVLPASCTIGYLIPLCLFKQRKQILQTEK